MICKPQFCVPCEGINDFFSSSEKLWEKNSDFCFMEIPTSTTFICEVFLPPTPHLFTLRCIFSRERFHKSLFRETIVKTDKGGQFGNYALFHRAHRKIKGKLSREFQFCYLEQKNKYNIEKL